MEGRSPRTTPDHRRRDPGSHVRVSPRVQSFRVTDVDEARQIFSGIYAEGRLEPERTAPFQWIVDLLSCGPIQLTRGHVNVGFSITASAVHDRRYIMILSGAEATEVETAGKRHAVVSGRSGVVLSPDRPVRLRSAPRFQGRNITIPGAALKAHLTALTGHAPAAPLTFDAALNFEARHLGRRRSSVVVVVVGRGS